MALHKKKGRRHTTKRTAWTGPSQHGDYEGGLNVMNVKMMLSGLSI